MRRNIKQVCEDIGWEYLGRFNSKYKIKYEGFEFYLDCSTFPPKELRPSKCLNKTEYARFLMSKRFDNRFEFNKFFYINNSEKSCVTCVNHGDFLISYNRFMTSKNGGCSFCKSEVTVKLNKDRTISIDDWVSRFKKVHGDLYDYSMISKIHSLKEVPIICEIHGVFEQIPYVHERGSGCPLCMKRSGHSKSSYVQPCADGSNLYIMEMTNGYEKFIKIGISKDVDRRVRCIEMDSPYRVLRYHSIYDKDAGIVYDVETRIHRHLYNSRYVPIFKFAGCTECFSIDYDEFLNYNQLCLNLENCFE